jgi:hypothetical protein
LGRGRGFPLQLAAMILGGLVMSFTYFAVNVFVKGLGPALASLARDVLGQTLVSAALASRARYPGRRVQRATLFTGEPNLSRGRACPASSLEPSLTS